MSKKSRKRNKKILAALALAGGAALMAKRGKGTGAVTGVVNPNAPKTEWISRKSDTGTNVVKNISKPVDHSFQTKFTKKVGDKWMGPNEIRLGNINPHEATAAAGAAYRPHRVPPGKMRTFKKGGRVTGIAKRGFGRALMKGKK